MRSFIIYNLSGHILRSGQVDDNTSQIIDQDNEFELIADVPENIQDYVVSNGELTLKPQSEIDNSNAETNWRIFRAERNALLMATDWTQAIDSPLSDEQKTAWATYRQNLRDMPGTVSDPSNASFPAMPD